MKTWSTLIYAKCSETNEYKTFCGQNIKAPTKKLAHEFCQNNGLGYLHISDELIMEIPCKSKSDYNPNLEKAIDFLTSKNKIMTAVEWLIEMLTEYNYLNKDADHYFEQALEMEKKQIIDTARISRQDDFWEKYKSYEQYYNETFSKTGD